MTQLSLSLATPRSLIYRRGGSLRLVLARVRSPVLTVARPPLPLNLALVIDRSGSMSGDPIAAARRAAAGVIERLGPADSLSLVSFETEPHVHLRATSMDEDGRRAAMRALEGVVSEGTTNLSGGWLHGAKCVADRMDEGGLAQNRVVLLSDGFANQGITDSVELQRHAEQLRVRGVFTSTVGVGDGYNPSLLQALAEHGGGRLHDAERPEEIVEVVLGEIAEARATVADDITLSLYWPRGVQLVPLGVFPSRPSSLQPNGHDGIDVTLGTLTADSTRLAVFRLQGLPSGAEHDGLEVSARLRWRLPGSTSEEATECAPLRFTFAGSRANSGQLKAPDLAMEGARAWLAWLVQQLVDLNREGRTEDAERLLRREGGDLRLYCKGLAGSDELIEQLETVGSRIREQWGERARKEIRLSTYKQLRSEKDLRTSSRDRWDRTLG